METEYGTKVVMEVSKEDGNTCVKKFLDKLLGELDKVSIDTLRRYIKEPPKVITKDWLESNGILGRKISSTRVTYGTEGVESYRLTQEFLGIIVESNRTLESQSILQSKTLKVLSNQDLITPTGYRIPLDENGDEIFSLKEKIEEIE